METMCIVCAACADRLRVEVDGVYGVNRQYQGHDAVAATACFLQAQCVIVDACCRTVRSVVVETMCIVCAASADRLRVEVDGVNGVNRQYQGHDAVAATAGLRQAQSVVMDARHRAIRGIIVETMCIVCAACADRLRVKVNRVYGVHCQGQGHDTVAATACFLQAQCVIVDACCRTVRSVVVETMCIVCAASADRLRVEVDRVNGVNCQGQGHDAVATTTCLLQTKGVVVDAQCRAVRGCIAKTVVTVCTARAYLIVKVDRVHCGHRQMQCHNAVAAFRTCIYMFIVATFSIGFSLPCITATSNS